MCCIKQKTLLVYLSMLNLQKKNAVLVKGEKIVSVGQFDAILKAFSDEAITINDQFSESVFVPGFINQHDHPWLGALTLNSAIISIEDWDLPTGFYPKASTAEQYLSLLRSAVQSHSQGDELFLSWGYHDLWHGALNREILDEISKDIPIAIWHRSVHEFIVNTKALELFEINQTVINGLTPEQQK